MNAVAHRRGDGFCAGVRGGNDLNIILCVENGGQSGDKHRLVIGEQDTNLRHGFPSTTVVRRAR